MVSSLCASILIFQQTAYMGITPYLWRSLPGLSLAGLAGLAGLASRLNLHLVADGARLGAHLRAAPRTADLAPRALLRRALEHSSLPRDVHVGQDAYRSDRYPAKHPHFACRLYSYCSKQCFQLDGVINSIRNANPIS